MDDAAGKSNAVNLPRIGLLLISAFGLFAGAQLSFSHMQSGETCPVLGPLPACYLVLAGYLAVFIAASFIRRPWSRKLFYMGLLPVFLLAAIGVTLELVQGETCPPGAMGIPQCFFSLAMATACLVLFRFARR